MLSNMQNSENAENDLRRSVQADMDVPLKMFMYRKTKPATSPLRVVQCRYLTVTWMIMCYEWGSDVVIYWSIDKEHVPS